MTIAIMTIMMAKQKIKKHIFFISPFKFCSPRWAWKCQGGDPLVILHSYGKIHHVQWTTPLFVSPCSVAIFVYKRVSSINIPVLSQ